jgi:hypothetical protein
MVAAFAAGIAIIHSMAIRIGLRSFIDMPPVKSQNFCRCF